LIIAQKRAGILGAILGRNEEGVRCDMIYEHEFPFRMFREIAETLAFAPCACRYSKSEEDSEASARYRRRGELRAVRFPPSCLVWRTGSSFSWDRILGLFRCVSREKLLCRETVNRCL
jgi:hypothetical protein